MKSQRQQITVIKNNRFVRYVCICLKTRAPIELKYESVKLLMKQLIGFFLTKFID